ncbi:all-trans retinoic acid-induced differentiation factor-like [Haliotis rufescens]|uniref:all-trans retinoic acid-induced differentiation factor-like n=1 Tax=Haliotis rufescens TaxID=6454 RepID=UPI001EAFF3A9|nr:all-trans retinoic acid-induced differentiation factor-like [Haliotis rufescens]
MTPFSVWFLIVTFAIYFVYCSASEKQSDVCSKTCSSSMNDSYVTDFCHEHSLQVQGRCCVNVTRSHRILLGLDVQGCGLSQLTGLFTDGASLQVVLLQDNPVKNISRTDFEGLLELQYLALPAGSDCPGGVDAWETTNTTANETLCLQELDFCLVHNVSCPSNSYCANTAPGMSECLCLPGYHGYKCLRKGTFPTTVFTAGMVGSTILVAGLLWATQRRNVKKLV